jgi:transcriptional regulator with XRE-family HTH domain
MKRTLTLKSVGEVIRALRAERGWSLEEMTKHLGWADRSRLSKYETNALALSLPVLEEIAHVLDLRPEVLVLRCLKRRYPSLGAGGNEISRLLEQLVIELGELRD